MCPIQILNPIQFSSFRESLQVPATLPASQKPWWSYVDISIFGQSLPVRSTWLKEQLDLVKRMVLTNRLHCVYDCITIKNCL